MDVHIVAERDYEIEAVHVRPGERIAAKDLLIELKGPALSAGVSARGSAFCDAKITLPPISRRVAKRDRPVR
ncbi:hypothetical protein [Cupriavidus sp. YAF13]|uniref:hypothetical protein n=1 Tax=Cupriavidus sp. YAF13 TaxID=3233075 RepID=UPI003F905F6A